MRYSKLFGKTSQTIPHDADSVNAKFLTQGGFIDKLGAGIYNYLPLGHRVFSKICQIVREEMNSVDGQEILMPALHPIEIWQQTGRDKTCDPILFRTKGANDKDFVFGPSHEETVTPLASKFVKSYKDLPFAVYQLQTKFRNEPRAKSGVLRGREFGMKDMYSFHTDEADLDAYYDKVLEAYKRVYKRCGLTAYVVEASGGIFSDKFSHEFSVVTPAGEDKIFVCEKCDTARNSELVNETDEKKCDKCGNQYKEVKAVEAGNIFKLGTKFSEDFDLNYTSKEGERKLVVMGCYGIGLTRLIGTIVEASHDEKGIIWPKSVAPYTVHLLNLGVDAETVKASENLYKELTKAGVEVLFDDRDESAGKKLNDADLIGIPYRVLVSKKTLADGMCEFKARNKSEAEKIKLSEIKSYIAKSS